VQQEAACAGRRRFALLSFIESVNMRINVISPDIVTYGAMVIGGVLREQGHDLFISRSLEPAGADILMLSLYSTQHLLDERIRRLIASHQENGGRCYVGGPVSAHPAMVLSELLPDAVVVGEGEVTAPRLVQEGPSPDIPGIAYMEEAGMVYTGPSPPAPMERPLPLIPADIGEQNVRGANVYIETHRGCIGGCGFCQVPRFFGREVRSRRIGDILTEVEAFKNAGAWRISISGGTGSLYASSRGRINPGAFADLLAGIAGIVGAKNLSSPDIRVDCITDEVLDAIRDHTIGWVFFGIESGSEQVLRRMRKGTTVDQVREAVDRCRSHGLQVAGSFIVGYPGESPEDYQRTKDLIAELSLDDVFVSVAEPIPGTPLADLVLSTPEDENPVYMPHSGEYRALGLSEAEARAFDLMLHADLYKSRLTLGDARTFDLYLAEVRKQGSDIRAATACLFRYGNV